MHWHKQIPALAVWFSLDHSGFLNEGFQMKCTKEFQSTERKRNRTGEGKACSLHGCTNSDFWATEQSKEETMIEQHF